MKLRDLLELCRVSNLPTVWSNTTVGLFAGVLVFDVGLDLDDPIEASIAGFCLALFAIAMSLIYCGGMILNDLVDHAIDAAERPTRPIPSGRVTASEARALTLLAFACGFILIAFLENGVLAAACADHRPEGSIATLLLIATIILYNYTHQRTKWAILFMALCRSLIIITGVLLFGACDELFEKPNGLTYTIGPAATLFIYTLFISIVARNEMQPRWFGGPKTVMNMIAAMPLLDAVWLVAMGLWPVSLFCIACAGMTKLAHRKVAGS